MFGGIYFGQTYFGQALGGIPSLITSIPGVLWKKIFKNDLGNFDGNFPPPPSIIASSVSWIKSSKTPQ